ncbi:hypothetical protein A8M57_05125 [Yersinia pestis]|nr:hypothetical protein AU254_00880 [Yersinia pestis]KYP02604.1 hypothetical protein AU253_02550 [Yersinia pestis]PVU25718.1 hypothetical protein A8M57_05125 [Yersinia pestis]
MNNSLHRTESGCSANQVTNFKIIIRSKKFIFITRNDRKTDLLITHITFIHIQQIKKSSISTEDFFHFTLLAG